MYRHIFLCLFVFILFLINGDESSAEKLKAFGIINENGQSISIVPGHFEEDAKRLTECALQHGDAGVKKFLEENKQKVDLWKKEAHPYEIEANFLYGMALFHGIGVPQNPKEAIPHLMKGKVFYPHANYQLGLCYLEGIGTLKDVNRAIYFFQISQDHPPAFEKFLQLNLQKAEQENDANAQFRIAESYFYGRNVQRNQAQAAQWYRKAAENNHPDAQFQLYRLYNDNSGIPKDDTEAKRWLHQAAENGCLTAQEKLGKHYIDGYLVSKNEQEGFRWLCKAAEQKLSSVQIDVARCYKKGIGTEKNEAEAVKRFRYIAESKDHFSHAAWYELGLCYFAGIGVAEDKEEAVRCFLNSTPKNLAVSHHDDVVKKLIECFIAGYGVPEDPAELTYWYQKGAEDDIPVAMYQFALRLLEGKGIAKDEKEAGVWVEKSADRGNDEARYLCETCYFDREKGPQNIEKVLPLLRRAAAERKSILEIPEAIHQLAFTYGNNTSPSRRDKEGAIKWFHKLADGGYVEPQYALGEMYYLGKKAENDLTTAADWFRKAAEQGSAAGQYRLGWCYLFGHGLPKDESEAAKWFRRSAEQGYAKGQHLLGECYASGWGVAKNESEAVLWLRKASEQGIQLAAELLQEIE